VINVERSLVPFVDLYEECCQNGFSILRSSTVEVHLAISSVNLHVTTTTTTAAAANSNNNEGTCISQN
jgi:hypothetical protein